MGHEDRFDGPIIRGNPLAKNVLIIAFGLLAAFGAHSTKSALETGNASINANREAITVSNDIFLGDGMLTAVFAGATICGVLLKNPNSNAI